MALLISTMILISLIISSNHYFLILIMYDLAFETISNATLIFYDKIPVLITDPMAIIISNSVFNCYVEKFNSKLYTQEFKIVQHN